MKEQVDFIDATPSKRLYLSIIADYDLYKAICELVDNAIDIWTLNNRSNNITVNIYLDTSQQRIEIKDNAGGISEKDLYYIVSPGQSLNPQTENIIGIFGVGTKRAVVALSQDVKIRTRKNGETYQVEIDDDWINQGDSWTLPVYKVTNIEENSTYIELLKLRNSINEITIKKLQYYLSTTYAIFLKDKRLSLILNNEKLAPISYENWAFPPEYQPTMFTGSIPVDTNESVDIFAVCGLTVTSNEASGEYGVYFYCNDRLVGRALKSIDVGFGSGLAGKPGEEVSLTRVIVQLNGKAQYMPWNSSKSDINTGNKVFEALQDWLFKIVKHTASLSRRMRSLEGGWQENVFKYGEGEYKEESIDDFTSPNMSYLPPLPKSTPRYAKVVEQENKSISNSEPWTTGLYESIIAVDWILKTKLEQRNRFALILLDSTMEIAFKEYLVNNAKSSYSEKRLAEIFSNRLEVHKEIQSNISITESLWKKIKHFYDLRCQLVHRKATVSISDNDITQFRKLVEDVLKKLYKLKFPK